MIYTTISEPAKADAPLARQVLNPNVLRGRKPKAMTFTFSCHPFPKCRATYWIGYLHRPS